MNLLLPETIGQYQLKTKFSGEQALLRINKLHGKTLHALDGVVGIYAGPGKDIQIWISRADSAKEARRQAGEMVHRMFENAESPFIWRKRMDFKGVSVYPFIGMGQVHLIFHQGDLVYWLSVNKEQEQDALSAFITG